MADSYTIPPTNGFALDNGAAVYFPSDAANRVLSTATAGSLVEVNARLRGSLAGDVHMDAIFMDTKRSTSFDAPSPPRSPEVPTGLAPSPETAAPLDPSLKSYSEQLYSEHAAPQPLTTSNIVADEMDQAYDGLHRTQAMLAYLKMMKQENSAIGQYLDEAKHTYVQALSRYQARDLEGAREFAAASSSLSRLVEILISRSFHSNSDYPKLVPPPPEHVPACGDTAVGQHDLDRVERLLARIRWVTENGTLPSEDRAQVQKLSLWSENLRRWARRLLEAGAMEDATEFAQAADAAARSAEHLCRSCYVTRGADSSTTAAP